MSEQRNQLEEIMGPMPDWTPEWSTKLDCVKDGVLALICAGTRLDPVTLDQIEGGFGLAWDDVWTIVERLWEEGHPVCTNGGAFWRAHDQSDFGDTIAYVEDEMDELQDETECMKRAAERLPVKSPR